MATYFIHMVPLRKSWNLESIRCEALKYKTRGDFERNSTAYSAASKRGIIDKVCSHMTKAGGASVAEIDLMKIIKKVYLKATKLRDLKVKIPDKPYIKGFDLDIYIPELRKAIEFDGSYWHSVSGLKRSRSSWPIEDLKNYHQLKDNHFKRKGIEVLHIKEVDWKKDKNKEIRKCLDFLDI